MCCFFCFKQKTAYDMRISDWSSDVCSSDLFENITFDKFIRPYIDSVDKARAMVQQINKAAETDGFRPIIFDTIVNQDIREILATSNGFMIDIFSTFLAPLEQELSEHSSYSVGKRSEEHTSELQSLMRTSYAVFCSKKKK